MIADSCAGRMSITALPPGFRRSRIWAQQLVIELANLFDRVLQFLIITQPSLNLGNSLPTHAELLSASAPVAYRQHWDCVAFASLALRAATLVADDAVQQCAAQQLAGDRQLFDNFWRRWMARSRIISTNESAPRTPVKPYVSALAPFRETGDSAPRSAFRNFAPESS